MSPATLHLTRNFVRKHGLQCPINMYQLISWILFIFDLLISFLVYLPPRLRRIYRPPHPLHASYGAPSRLHPPVVTSASSQSAHGLRTHEERLHGRTMSNSSSFSSYTTFSSTSSKPPANAPHRSCTGQCQRRMLPEIVVETIAAVLGCHLDITQSIMTKISSESTRTLTSSNGSLPPSSAVANCPSEDISQMYILCVAGSAEPPASHSPSGLYDI